MHDPNPALDRRAELALQHYRSQRFSEAEALCRQVLAEQPENPDAMEIIGLLAYQAGQTALALQWVERAIQLKPAAANYHNDLGLILLGHARTDEAIAAFERAVSLRPDYVEAHNNLGTCLRRLGRYDEAVAAFGRAVTIKPDFAEAHYNLGNALSDSGRIDDSINANRQAILLRPGFDRAQAALADGLRRAGRRREAVAELRRLIELKPDFVDAWNNLGMELQALGDMDEAIAAYRRAAELGPDQAVVHYNLGNALKDRRLLDEAIAAYRRAISLWPGFFAALSNLGNVLKDTAQLDEGIACMRQAIAISPAPISASSLLCALHYPDDCDPIQLFEEHRLWNERYARPLAKSRKPHANDRNPDRRLRIGYVSADFLGHPVGCCLLPVLANRDRSGFEIFCYSNVRRPDGVTERLRPLADVWRETTAVPDEQLAQIIRDDQIDILVDLSVHTGGNRQLVFARKPAPVQVTWLGWPGTTGQDAMDYRLSDPYLDPPAGSPGDDLRLYSEKTIRLPHSFWCYGPLGDQPGVNELPAMRNGFVTFGCLNNFCKVTGLSIDLWAEVLSRNARSRILILAPPGNSRERVTARFQHGGISADRIEFASRCPQQQYLELYRRLDISLDPVPYGGHTTSMDSFWMGVPVVSLTGVIPVWRTGLSIASNLGMPELAAQSPKQYVSIAYELASDLSHLAGLRAALREQMESSPIADAPRYARNLEAIFRRLWQSACER